MSGSNGATGVANRGLMRQKQAAIPGAHKSKKSIWPQRSQRKQPVPKVIALAPINPFAPGRKTSLAWVQMGYS
jgi:hypothetical protein